MVLKQRGLRSVCKVVFKPIENILPDSIMFPFIEQDIVGYCVKRFGKINENAKDGIGFV